MSITEGNWDLHKTGSQDAARHREKLKEAFKKNLHEIISQEDIITSEKGKKIKVPIKSLDSYRFIFDHKKNKHVGQGDGNTEKGDVLEKEEKKGEKPGDKAGDEPGTEYYEAEIDLEDLVEMMLEDLKLPRLDPKKQMDMKVNDVRYDEIRKKGVLSNLDKKRSLVENIKRNAAHGNPVVGDINEDDLRFRSWRDKESPITSAVVIAMMDVSGSMTQEKKYIARSFFFWMVNFLKNKYEDVQVEFISHTTDAKICTEHEFFYKAESGGTKCSSAYDLALELITTKYDPNLYNIFVFHFSDGDTFGDEDKCVSAIKTLSRICNMVGYGEINPQAQSAGMFGYMPTKLSAIYLNQLGTLTNFVMAKITNKNDVWPTLKRFFGTELKD